MVQTMKQVVILIRGGSKAASYSGIKFSRHISDAICAIPCKIRVISETYSGWTKKVPPPPIIIRLLCIKDKKFQNNSEICTVPSR